MVKTEPDSIFGSISYDIDSADIFRKLTQSITIVIILDVSGSMMTRIDDMNKSLLQFLEFLESGISYLKPDVHINLAIVYFGSEVVQVFPKDEGIGRIVIGTTEEIKNNLVHDSLTYTYMYKVLTHCKDKVLPHVPVDSKLIKFLMTDGEPNDIFDDSNRESDMHKRTKEAKEEIKKVYSNISDVVIAVGSTKNYDATFLSCISHKVKMAYATSEILDAIQFEFLESISDMLPKNVSFRIPSKLTIETSSDSIPWQHDETTNTMLMDIGNITIGFRTMFTIKLKTPLSWLPIVLYHGDNRDIGMVTLEEPTDEEHSLYQLFQVRNILKEKKRELTSNEDIDTKQLLEEIKKYENMARVNMNNNTLSFELQDEWNDIFSTTKNMATMLSNKDFDSYSTYVTITPSVGNSSRTALMRNMSNRPVDYNGHHHMVSQAIGFVKYKCCICMDEMDTPMVLKCGHTMCSQCIVTMADTSTVASTCPKCRKSGAGKLDCIKMPIYPENKDDYKKCLTKDCPNRYKYYNYPCMHVTSCYECISNDKTKKCNFEGCGKQIQYCQIIYNDYV